MEDIKTYIKDHLKNVEKSDDFVTYLNKLLTKYNIDKNSDLYNKANISKQLFSAIISHKCNPSLDTCLKIAFTLKLTNHECKYLLKKAGHTLPSSNKYALIIRYCFENKIYDLVEVNKLLESNGLNDFQFK